MRQTTLPYAAILSTRVNHVILFAAAISVTLSACSHEERPSHGESPPKLQAPLSDSLDVNETETTIDESDRREEQAEAVDILVEDFARQAKKSLSAAKELYEGKEVSITGVVDRFNFGDDGDGFAGYVLLAPEVQTDENKYLRTSCRSDDIKLWEHVAPGNRVTLKGVPVFTKGIARIFDCSVVSAEGEPASNYSFSAEELVRAYFKDPVQTSAQHLRKQRFISGKVKAIGGDLGVFHGSKAELLLEGEGENSFAIDYFSSTDEEYFSGLKTGDTITIYGTLAIDQSGDHRIGIDSAKLVTFAKPD